MTTRRFTRTLPWVPLLAAILLLATPGTTSGVQPDPAEPMGLTLDAAAAFCQFTPPSGATSIDRSWMAVAASGDVASRAPGTSVAAWVPVRRGGRVESMSHVRAAARGQATLTRDGDVILVSPGSELTLPDDSAERFDVIRQDAGQALYKVKPGRQGRFEVITPMLVAGVKGTQFSVVVREDFVAVEVVEGHVEVQSLLDRNDRRDLFAGDLITMRADEGRMEMHGEDRGARNETGKKRAQEAREVRKETRDLVSDMVTETMTFDLDGLWKERMTERIEEKYTGTTTSVTDTTDRLNDMLDEKQNQKAVDDVIKILCGGSVSRGNNSGSGGGGSGSGSGNSGPGGGNSGPGGGNSGPGGGNSGSGGGN